MSLAREAPALEDVHISEQACPIHRHAFARVSTQPVHSASAIICFPVSRPADAKVRCRGPTLAIDTLQAGHTYCLRDLLRRWKLPEEFHKKMASVWRCQLAPPCDTDAAAAAACMAGAPIMTAESCGARACSAVGPDALAFVQRPEWNVFPKQRVAMTSGWGAPGTRIASADKATLVNSFSEVLQSAAIVNLQLFHRDGADTPALPRLPELLDWPLLDGVLDGACGGGGVRCDMATRVSRRGAVTWWHIDDGGEFVLQVRPLVPSGRPPASGAILSPCLVSSFISQSFRKLREPVRHSHIVTVDDMLRRTTYF
jgi:hypothetical protein